MSRPSHLWGPCALVGALYAGNDPLISACVLTAQLEAGSLRSRHNGQTLPMRIPRDHADERAVERDRNLACLPGGVLCRLASTSCGRAVSCPGRG